jgi:hypothetical protein
MASLSSRMKIYSLDHPLFISQAGMSGGKAGIHRIGDGAPSVLERNVVVKLFRPEITRRGGCRSPGRSRCSATRLVSITSLTGGIIDPPSMGSRATLLARTTSEELQAVDKNLNLAAFRGVTGVQTCALPIFPSILAKLAYDGYLPSLIQILVHGLGGFAEHGAVEIADFIFPLVSRPLSPVDGDGKPTDGGTSVGIPKFTFPRQTSDQRNNIQVICHTLRSNTIILSLIFPC